MSEVSFESLWEEVCKELAKKYGMPTVKSWLSSIQIKSLEEGVLHIEVGSRFSKDWISQRYFDDILSTAKSINSSIQDLQISVQESLQANEIIAEETVIGSSQEANFGINLDPNFTFENFVVGKPNEFAHAAALRVAESEKAVFNPLFLYGGVGLGKTHLMHAIAWSIKKRTPRRRVVYISAEKFMYLFIRAVRFQGTMDFKESFRSIDVLMIDDIQFICGKESTQEEFFHTFNTLVDNNHQVIISADKSPSDLEGVEERLKSRLGWGLVADIHPTTYELRIGILQTKASHIKTHIPNRVLEFLAEKITSNVRELEGALNRVVATADLVGREITVESARDVLGDLIRSNDKTVTVEDIQKKVSSYYTIKLSDMYSPRRLKQVAIPRQIAMYLAKHLTKLSYPEIGRKFGGRDHTTVIHSVKKIEQSVLTDSKIAGDIQHLKEMLE